MSNAPLTGRGQLLAELSERFDRGEHVMLRGPAGIGKTRLAAELTATRAVGYRAVDRLLASDSTSRFQLGALASLGRPSGIAAGDLPALMSWYLGRWRSQRRSDKPPIVWLDDAHHVDGLSASVIRQAVAVGCVQLVATHRTPEPLPAEIESLVTGGELQILEVPPLDRTTTAALAAATADRSLGLAQLDAVYELSAGVPLYVRDLALTIGDSDAAPRVNHLADALGARFANLSPRDRRTAEMIAAAEPIGLDFLADRRDVVTALIDKGLVRRHGVAEVRLEHPLYGAWLLDSLGPLVTELYRELADRVRGATGAHVDPTKELDWRLNAGQEPSDQLIEEAARLAIIRSDGQAALRFVEGRQGFDLLRGQALLLDGDLEHGLEVLERCRRTETPNNSAEAASWLARYIGVGLKDYERAHQILEEADHPSLDRATRQLLMIGRVWMWMFGPGVPTDIGDRVAAVIDFKMADGPSYELAMAAAGLVYQIHEPSRSESLLEFVRWVEERIEIDSNSICRARAIEGWANIFSGDPQRGFDLMASHLDLAKSQDLSEGVGLVGGTCAMAAAIIGQIQRSVDLASQASAAVEGQDWFRYGVIAREVGRGNAHVAGLPAAESETATVHGRTGEGASLSDLEDLFRVRADVLARQRRGQLVDEQMVIEVYERIANNHKLAWLATLPPEYLDRSVPRAVHAFVRDALDPDRTDVVHHLAHRLASARLDHHHDQLVSVATEYERIGFTPAASRAFADVAVLEPIDSPLRPTAMQGVVRSLRRWDGGPTWWTAEISDLPTPRQIEIMWRVVDGERPPEVARALDLSIRTVENHLYRVYRSLGLSGQGELLATMGGASNPA